MKSAELYRLLRSDLGPWFRERGFKAVPRTQLGWHRDRLLIWFQCDKSGWNRYAGSSFFVNIQTSAAPEPWSGPVERLQRFLSDAELEQMRALQNEVIRNLLPPPREYVEQMRDAFSKYRDGAAMLEAMLGDFQPVSTPYRQQQDVSLRYFSPSDVQRWSTFLLGIFPRIVTDSPDNGNAAL